MRKKANEAVGVETQRLSKLVLDGVLTPADRDAAVWFLIGQFKTSMEKVLAAVEEDRDELSAELSSALEGEMATVARLRTILGDVDEIYSDWASGEHSDEWSMHELGKPLGRFHEDCAQAAEAERAVDEG